MAGRTLRALTHTDPLSFDHAMDPHDNSASSTRDRRTKPRRASNASVRVLVAEQEITGQADDISRSGILFFTDSSLKIEIEIEEDGRTTRRTGRLVRAQVMSPDRIGWAVEFENE
jgi:hypothetical protein